MAKVLLFQCKNEQEIRQVLTPMKIPVKMIPEEYFHLTLGELEKGKFSAGNADVSVTGNETRYPAESLMVMCDVTEKQMNRLLTELRRREIRVDYKAMLTPTNRTWKVGQMYLEMARERAMYLRMKK